MSAQTPRLITFGLSHYCEKARWALDWHGVDFDEVGWPPGPHRLLVRRLGTGKTTLPILQLGETIVQGSGEIIDWAEANTAGGTPSLAPQGDPQEAHAIEQRADEVMGPEVRRHLYAETIERHHRVLRPTLFMNAAPSHRLLGSLMWPVTRQIIKRSYDATTETAPDSRAKLEIELDWLDAELADGRRYLVGDRFSQVDLTVASLLAVFARPKQSQVFHVLPLPPALAEDVARWDKRPVMKWVRDIYGRYRRRPAARAA